MTPASQRPRRPGSIATCCVPDGRNPGGTCKWTVVPSAEIPLCARHIIIAAHAHKEIGAGYLTSVVIAEEQQ